MGFDSFVKNYNRALRFLSYRPRSRRELVEFLKKKEVEEQEIEEIAQKLENEKLINDWEFAIWFIGSRVSFRPKSHRVLRFELLRKGVAGDIVEKILSETQDDYHLARILVQKKKRLLGNLPQDQKKEKIMRFLLSRGFDWETVKSVIDAA